MSRTLVQISLLTLLVFASFTDAFGQRSTNLSAGNVIGNNASSKMTVIKEPLPKTSTRSGGAVTRVAATQTSVRVTVIGQVSAPGVYEFRNGAPDLQEVVEQAGNLTRFCGHEFFVWNSNDKQLQLNLPEDIGYRFEDGDILLAETSTRYYRALGNRKQAETLAEIHPATQIVLLNVLDHPVLLSLQPEDAKFSYLASLLNQNPTSLVGRVEHIVPPNASAIPADAIIAPDMIFSGSIMKFEPGAIDQSKLPHLPDPVLVKTSSKVRTASAESVPRNAGWSREQGVLMVQPVKSESQTPFASNHGPASEPIAEPESESTENPFDDMFAEFEATSDETLESDVPEVLMPAKDAQEVRPLLSAQQWRIIVTFVTLMMLFLIAWYIRQRQQKSGIKTFNFVESHITASPVSGSDPSSDVEHAGESTEEQAAEEKIIAAPSFPQMIEPQSDEARAAVPAPADEARDKILELERVHENERTEAAGTQTVQATEAHELSSYDSPRNEDFIDEKAYEISIEELKTGSEIEAFDQVETPHDTPTEPVASFKNDLTEEESRLETPQDEAHHAVDNLEQPASRVQQSLLGTPWMQELSPDLDPQESDISLEKGGEQPADAPAAEAEVEEAKPQPGSKTASGLFAAQQLRIDQAHTFEPHPAARPTAPGSASEQDVDKTTSDSEAAGVIPPPSAAPNWMKMADHPQQPEENLDHIFQAIMRERKK